MDAIKTVGLTKKYKDVIAVNHLDLQIKQGELYSLLGVNVANQNSLAESPSPTDTFAKSICSCMPNSVHATPKPDELLKSHTNKQKR